MAQTKYVAHNARELKNGIEAAEKIRNVQNRPGDGWVNIKPAQIKTRSHLFQPRDLRYIGRTEVDPDYVNKLARRIGIVGELDPPTVIKLGIEWVCVDGHHRIAAYKRADAKWKGPIKCFWFGGTIHEAVEVSVRENMKEKLELSRRDRSEMAWKLVLIDSQYKYSIAETAKLCGISERAVSNMRKVKKAYNDSSDQGARGVRDRLRKQLGPLEEARWVSAWQVYTGLEREEIDDEEAAQLLSRYINRRLADRLKRDPRVTARALEIHDATLPARLTAAWQEPRTVAGDDEDDALEHAKAAIGRER